MTPRKQQPVYLSEDSNLTISNEEGKKGNTYTLKV
jgi:hypothetical protein